MRSSLGTRWTAAEDTILRAGYAQGHGCYWSGWYELLPGRSVYAINNHAQKLGVGLRRNHKWTPKDDQDILSAIDFLAEKLQASRQTVMRRVVTLYQRERGKDG